MYEFLGKINIHSFIHSLGNNNRTGQNKNKTVKQISDGKENKHIKRKQI